jgi:hypothetical protein
VPIYFAQFVVVEENRWLSATTPFPVVRRSLSHRIATQLFAASDADAAYRRASAMVGGFSNSHNDGPGDQTNFRCVGLHDLEEVFVSEKTLVESLDNPFGVEVGQVDVGDFIPLVRKREALSLFLERHSQ